MSDEKQHDMKHHHHDHEAQYGIFHPDPVAGFPQPAPPPGASGHPSHYYHGYQAVPGYVDSEGTSSRPERPLPCCGCGIGWFLFIIGFALAGLPWYLAAFVMLFSNIDPREKPGYIACVVAAILGTVAIIIGATN